MWTLWALRVLPQRPDSGRSMERGAAMTDITEDQLIQRSSDILGGIPVFIGTRVPVRTLIDYLEAGERLDDFLDDFPTVSRDQATGVLELVKATLLAPQR